MDNKRLGIFTISVLIIGILVGAWADGSKGSSEITPYTISCDNQELTSMCIIRDDTGNAIVELSMVEATENDMFKHNENIAKWVNENMK